jgi:hypothetical protein
VIGCVFWEGMFFRGCGSVYCRYRGDFLSDHFWFHIRMLGWVVLLLWYILYTINAVTPIFVSSFVFISHGITGVAGTVLVLVGYFYLNETRPKEKK